MHLFTVGYRVRRLFSYLCPGIRVYVYHTVTILKKYPTAFQIPSHKHSYRSQYSSFYRLPSLTPSPLPPPAPDGCPATWDGWQCWPHTPRGQRAQRPCPPHIYYFTTPPSCPSESQAGRGVQGLIWGVEWISLSES